MKRPILLSVSVLLLVGCQDQQVPTEPLVDPPLPSISDGAQAGGNPNFFFLPPMVKNPSGHPDFDPGGFNGTLSPTVEICKLDGSACAASQDAGFPIRFTRTTGPGGETIRVSVTDEHYHVNWHTDRFNLTVGAQYRIQVIGAADDQVWGYADVQPVSSGKELKSLTDGTVIGLVDGRTLPIKFRPEFGVYTANCFNNDCVEQVVGAGGGTVTTPEKFAGVEIPAGALDNDVTIIIARVNTAEGPCLPTDFQQFEGCYRYDTDPDLREVQNSGLDQFNVNVIVGVCLVPESADQVNLQLYKFDPEADETPVALPSVAETFLDCVGFNGGEPIGGLAPRWLRDLAGTGWRAVQRHVGPWFSPPPLVAGDNGLGGLTGSFSRIGWLRPATMSLNGGDGQSGPINGTLEGNLSVLVQGTHPATAPLGGALVTFSVTGGGGGLRAPGSEDALAAEITVTTDAEGIASARWTLGDVAGDQTVIASAPADGSPVTFTATAGGADLIIESLTHLPVDPNAADLIEYTAVVTNIGTGPSGPFVVVVQVNRDAEGTPGDLIESTSFFPKSLQPGESVSLRRQRTLQLAAGDYINTAFADFNEEVVETNEDNNTATDAYTVTLAPDLIVESLTHDPANPHSEDLITFTAVVTNAGPGPARPSTLEFRIGGETPGAPETQFAVPALAVEQSFTVQRQATLIAQNYRNTAVADVDNDVGEANETNNETTDDYTVLPVDQSNDPATGTSFGCGVSGTSLYQSFTPARSPLVAVELRLRAGGSFPIEGTTTDINIRDESPTGTILASAATLVSGPRATGEQILVRFEFSPDVTVTTGNPLVIEWLSPAPEGEQAGTILTWMGSQDDPYAGGNAFSCNTTAVPADDLNFRTISR